MVGGRWAFDRRDPRMESPEADKLAQGQKQEEVAHRASHLPCAVPFSSQRASLTWPPFLDSPWVQEEADGIESWCQAHMKGHSGKVPGPSLAVSKSGLFRFRPISQTRRDVSQSLGSKENI